MKHIQDVRISTGSGLVRIVAEADESRINGALLTKAHFQLRESSAANGEVFLHVDALGTGAIGVGDLEAGCQRTIAGTKPFVICKGTEFSNWCLLLEGNKNHKNRTRLPGDWKNL